MTEIGRKLEVGIAIESTRGTAISSPSKWLKHVSADILPKNEKVIDDNSRGRLEESEGARVTKKWYEGPVEGILHIDLLGYLLTNMYGLPTTTTVSGSVKSHVFALNQSIEHPTLTLFRKDGAVIQKAYAGGVVKTLEINGSVDDYVRFSAEFAAASEGANASSPTYATEYDFIGKDVTVKVADSQAGLAGATALKIKDFSVSWDQGAIVDHVLGSYTPDSIYNGAQKIEVSFNKNYTDTTFEDLFNSDTYKYMSLTIQGDALLAVGHNPTITIILNRAQVQSWERSGGADELVTEDVTIKAFYNQTDSAMSGVTLKNLTGVYTV